MWEPPDECDLGLVSKSLHKTKVCAAQFSFPEMQVSSFAFYTSRTEAKGAFIIRVLVFSDRCKLNFT